MGAPVHYSANLIRALSAPFAGFGGVYAYNKRFSRGLQFGVNYTWSKTILYQHYQWVPDQLNKNVTSRPHAVNFNFGYDLPNLSHRWNKELFDLSLSKEFRIAESLGAGTVRPVEALLTSTNGPCKLSTPFGAVSMGYDDKDARTAHEGSTDQTLLARRDEDVL